MQTIQSSTNTQTQTLMRSPAELLASLPKKTREAELAKLDTETRAALQWRWKFWARPDQIEPPGDDWLTWCAIAGRGWGKTRAGSEWVRSYVCGDTPLAKGRASRVALIAETAADARDVIVEGDSGLMKVHSKDFRPTYEPSKRRLTWPNGAIATLFNATEPDQLRGPQFDLAWCDELAKWRYAESAWDMLQFGLRLGDRPRALITTTPRPIVLLKKIIADSKTVVTRGRTYDNAANLAPSFLEALEKKYEGTRLGRQEIDAEILDDVPGSLWTRDMLDRNRRKPNELPDMQRVVVAIDPAGKSQETAISEGTAETGIVVAGIGVDGRGYVIDDVSCSLSPHGWARRALSAYDMHKADCIVVETNQGGDMVKSTIHSVRPGVSVREVHASRGKVTRAEPIAALYEQDRISHVGTFAQMEDQQVLFTPLGIAGDTTGDRVDALVWALTQLFPSIINIGPQEDFSINDHGGAGSWLS